MKNAILLFFVTSIKILSMFSIGYILGSNVEIINDCLNNIGNVYIGWVIFICGVILAVTGLTFIITYVEEKFCK